MAISASILPLNRPPAGRRRHVAISVGFRGWRATQLQKSVYLRPASQEIQPQFDDACLCSVLRHSELLDSGGGASGCHNRAQAIRAKDFGWADFARNTEGVRAGRSGGEGTGG